MVKTRTKKRKSHSAGGVALRGMDSFAKRHHTFLIYVGIAILVLVLFIFVSTVFGHVLFAIGFLASCFGLFMAGKVGWRLGERIEENYLSWRRR
mgnify:CR=1 FL=1